MIARKCKLGKRQGLTLLRTRYLVADNVSRLAFGVREARYATGLIGDLLNAYERVVKRSGFIFIGS